MRVLYFGCLHPHGHYLYSADGDVTWKPITKSIDPMKLDATLTPKFKNGAQPQNTGLLHRVDDTWTVFAFWDRTGDSRGNSNSAFIVEGTLLSLEQVIAAVRSAFPGLVERMELTGCAFTIASEATSVVAPA